MYVRKLLRVKPPGMQLPTLLFCCCSIAASHFCSRHSIIVRVSWDSTPWICLSCLFDHSANESYGEVKGTSQGFRQPYNPDKWHVVTAGMYLFAGVHWGAAGQCQRAARAVAPGQPSCLSPPAVAGSGGSPGATHPPAPPRG